MNTVLDTYRACFPRTLLGAAVAWVLWADMWAALATFGVIAIRTVQGA